MRTSARGYVVVWVLVVLSLVTAGLTSVAFTRDGPIALETFLVFGIAAGIAALGLRIEAKRDLYAFSMVATVATFITAVITGSVALLGQQPHPVAGGVAIVATSALAACVYFLISTQYGRENLPNVLRERFHPSVIYELDGVQFVSAWAPEELSAGDGLLIRVFAQNCWDAPRTLTFGLKAGTRLSLVKEGLHFQASPEVTIPGAAVVLLTIPVVAHARAKGRYTLLAKPRVAGEGGTRVRRWRGKALGMRIPLWLTALGPLIGFVAWGGGITIKVRVAEGKRASEPVRTPESLSEIVWCPEPDALTEDRPTLDWRA